MSISHSDSAKQFETTLAALGIEDLNQLAAAAPAKIDGWITLLQGDNGTTYNTIIGDLVALKGYLTGGDAAQISASLQTLAEHINALADGANPIFLDSLYKLGQKLSDLARELKQVQQ
ncbi:hypothetical protein [Hymenobacter cavernae]|uniref:DUF1641 domain-containing protein n=1 Tax=Hymenobacter cavernae TaxID=2044852 RepID=A0ABQ1TI50_9BACT|nr:hypothetical protein [Hymenobacter cavernae]GGE93987.1 hypothetical protein GCM10011383_00830 [Hymenobacter cavernae]